MPKSKTTSRLASLVIATWVLLPSPGMGAQLTTPVLVQDFAPGVGTAEIDPQSLATAGDLLYFSGFDPEHGDEPWPSSSSRVSPAYTSWHSCL